MYQDGGSVHKLTYRKASVFDAVVITDMWGKMMKESTAHPYIMTRNQDLELFCMRLIPKIYDDNWVIIMADDGDKSVGFRMLEKMDAPYNDGLTVLRIDSLYIEPEYRNGEATEYFSKAHKEQIEELETDMNVDEIEFTTAYEPSLVRFWGRRGFVPSQITFRMILRRDDNG
jgi:hypothetical protein